MKVRIQAKRRFAHRLAYLAWFSYMNKRLQAIADKINAPDMSPEAVAKREADFNTLWNSMVANKAKALLVEPDPEVEAAKQEFICVKVKDGSVVDTFDTREEALGLLMKHARHKKAKLSVIDSSTGEYVLFTEEELA